MQPALPTEARDVGDALDDRPVPAVWPRPTCVGNEKYFADFWILEAFDLDVASKLATEGSKALRARLSSLLCPCVLPSPRGVKTSV
jgi:hypothetical protein